jgi:hypothetical protein
MTPSTDLVSEQLVSHHESHVIVTEMGGFHVLPSDSDRS